MIPVAVLLLALVGVIAFPWPYALFLAIVASLYVPLAGLALGIISDALYYTHAASLIPWGTLVGGIVTVLAYLARRFMKARVSDLSL
jgi:hypothetical protein